MKNLIKSFTEKPNHLKDDLPVFPCFENQNSSQNNSFSKCVFLFFILFSMFALNCSGNVYLPDMEVNGSQIGLPDVQMPTLDSGRDCAAVESYGVLQNNTILVLQTNQLSQKGIQLYPYVCLGSCRILCPDSVPDCITKVICMNDEVSVDITEISCNWR